MIIGEIIMIFALKMKIIKNINTRIKIKKSFLKLLKLFIKNFMNKETPNINKNKLNVG